MRSHDDYQHQPYAIGEEAVRCLTHQECERWCLERGYPVSRSPHSGRPEPDVRRRFKRIDLAYPADSGRKVTLARNVLTCLQKRDEVLLWMDDWAVWPSSQHMPLFTRFREALGERRRLIEAPGHALLVHEFDDALSVLAVALLFIWDCHVFSGVGRPVFFCSHDETASLLVPRGETCEQELDAMAAWIARPQAGGVRRPRSADHRRRRS